MPTTIDTRQIQIATSVRDKNVFKLKSDNRPINKNHVRTLRDSILEKNMLRQNPIIVNEDHVIVDGQHRWMAIKDLEDVELAYIYTDDYDEQDILMLNTNQRNWTMADYAHHFADKGNPEYQLVLDLTEKFKLPITSVIEIMGDSANMSSAKFKDGRFKISADDRAPKLLDWVSRYYDDGYNFASHLGCIRALREAMRNDAFSLQELEDKMHSANVIFRKQPNKYHYLRMFEDIINFRRHHHTRINLTT